MSSSCPFDYRRFKRKIEEIDDDDISDHISSIRSRTDDHNLAFLPDLNTDVEEVSSQEITRASTPHHIQFFVRMMSESKTLVLRGNPHDKIKVIHEKIQAVTGIPATEQRLIYRGRQLQWDRTLAECMIENDAGLHLVGRMQSTEHKHAWSLIDELVSNIHRLCNLEDENPEKTVQAVNSMMIVFLDKAAKKDICEDHLASHLNIFQSLSAPAALVMFYMSPYKGIKDGPEHLFRLFINSCRNSLPRPLYLQCTPVVLEFCKLLSRAGVQDDSVYNFCLSSLGSMVKDLKIGRNLKDPKNTCKVNVGDIFPFVTELSDKLTGANSIISGNDVGTFAAFLRPIKRAIKDFSGFKGVIPVPLTYTLPCYDDETKLLYMILLQLKKKMVKCLAKLERGLRKKRKELIEYDGCDQYLVILKEMLGISKLYRGSEEMFWSDMQKLKVSVCYLIVKYAKRGENYGWIIGHNDILDFKSRRHLVMLLFPELRNSYEEVHEMLIDRFDLLSESFEYILGADPVMLRGELLMGFKNEEATGPGVLREWFFLVCKEIFNPQNGLFIACPNDRKRFFPNPASKVDPMHLKYFKFAGRVIALALMRKIQVGIVFDRSFFLQLSGDKVTLEDIKAADPYVYRSCKQILDMDPALVDQDVLGLTFVDEVEELGSVKVVELYTNGEHIIVNSRNRKAYVDLLIQYRFVTSVTKQVTEFAEGFADIVGGEDIQKSIFKRLEFEDLDGMLHGSETLISVEDWKAHTDYNGYKVTDPQIKWFWKILKGMTAEQRKVLLFFWTSLTNLPVEGFGGLDSKLYIYKSSESQDYLPSSHTCFYRITFPAYPSLRVMRKRFDIITQDYVRCSFGTG